MTSRVQTETGECGLLARQFGRFIGNLAKESDGPWLDKIAQCLLTALEEGHVCLAYEDWAALVTEEKDGTPPDQASARRKLLETGVVGEDPLGGHPLVLSETNSLYLARYRHYELELVRNLKALANRCEAWGTPDACLEAVEHVFAGQDSARGAGQRDAVLKGLQRNLTLISGGPGTGKTSTVARLIAACIRMKSAEAAPTIALAAPTGKAATRLQEAVSAALQSMASSGTCPDYSLEAAQTVHRLLGARSGSVFFRHGEDNPLRHDLVVIDETSMLDLALMAKLLQAIDPERTRLVLLGDSDQLTSVQAGSLFGDLVQAALDPDSPLHPCCQRLGETFRFGHDSGIGRCVQAMQEGQLDAAEDVLFSGKWPDVEFVEWGEVPSFSSWVEKEMRCHHERLAAAETQGEVVAAMGTYRLLTALRQGSCGSDAVNGLLRQKFNPVEGSQGYYHGMPVQILQNDYAVKLFNGDTGVFWSATHGIDSSGQSGLKVLFPLASDGARIFSPSRLPRWEPAYAMTIHRSQGSEFDEVVLIFPPDDNRLLTRELIYTGLSRARKKVRILGSKTVLQEALKREVRRVSGIVEEMSKSKSKSRSTERTCAS